MTTPITPRLRTWARRAAAPLGLALASLVAMAPAQAQLTDPGLFLEEGGGTVTTLPAGVQRIADVPYGTDPLQRMDVYLPAAPRSSVEGPAPVIFMVHGGGWRTGDKTMSRVVQEKAARWVPRGFVFISVNYRLHPAVNVLQEAIDVALALDTAQKQAAQWGADPAKFILMGHSAGAHLVSFVNAHAPLLRQLGVTPWLGTVSLDSALLNAPVVMSLPHYPLYDEVLGSDPAFWLAISPYQAVTGAQPPYQFVCSTSRPDRPCLQAQGMAAHVQALGGRAEVLPQDLTHGEINANLGLDSDYTRAVETFMGSLDPVVAQRLR